MKTIKVLALTLALGVAGVVYAAGGSQAQAPACNMDQAHASCCTPGASCCTGGSCCATKLTAKR